MFIYIFFHMFFCRFTLAAEPRLAYSLRVERWANTLASNQPKRVFYRCDSSFSYPDIRLFNATHGKKPSINLRNPRKIRIRIIGNNLRAI